MESILKLKTSDNIPQRLREVRQNKGLAVTDLGMPHSSVTVAETGVYGTMKMSTFFSYLKGLGINKVEISIQS